MILKVQFLDDRKLEGLDYVVILKVEHHSFSENSSTDGTSHFEIDLPEKSLATFRMREKAEEILSEISLQNISLRHTGDLPRIEDGACGLTFWSFLPEKDVWQAAISVAETSDIKRSELPRLRMDGKRALEKGERERLLILLLGQIYLKKVSCK